MGFMPIRAKELNNSELAYGHADFALFASSSGNGMDAGWQIYAKNPNLFWQSVPHPCVGGSHQVGYEHADIDKVADGMVFLIGIANTCPSDELPCRSSCCNEGDLSLEVSFGRSKDII